MKIIINIILSKIVNFFLRCGLFTCKLPIYYISLPYFTL